MGGRRADAPRLPGRWPDIDLAKLNVILARPLMKSGLRPEGVAAPPGRTSLRQLMESDLTITRPLTEERAPG